MRLLWKNKLVVIIATAVLYLSGYLSFLNPVIEQFTNSVNDAVRTEWVLIDSDFEKQWMLVDVDGQEYYFFPREEGMQNKWGDVLDYPHLDEMWEYVQAKDSNPGLFVGTQPKLYNLFLKSYSEEK